MDDVKAITDDITEYTSSEDGVGKYLFQHIWLGCQKQIYHEGSMQI